MLRLYVLLFIFALSDTLGNSTKEGISPKLKFIGDYDGHSFFYDNTSRTRDAAKTYCSSMGMELAEILSSGTLKSLQSHHAVDSEFSKTACFWLSGEDIRTGAQFVWANSGRTMDPYLDWASIQGPYTCVVYESYGLYGYLCSSICYTMCQT